MHCVPCSVQYAIIKICSPVPGPAVARGDGDAVAALREPPRQRPPEVPAADDEDVRGGGGGGGEVAVVGRRRDVRRALLPASLGVEPVVGEGGHCVVWL